MATEDKKKEVKTPNNKDPKNKDPKNKKKEDRKRKITINLVVLASLFLLIIASLIFTDSTKVSDDEKNTFADLITEIREGDVSKIIVSEDKSNLIAEIYKTDAKDRNDTKEEIYPNISVGQASVLENINNALGEEEVTIGSGEGEIIYEETPKSFLTSLFESKVFEFLLYASIAGILILFVIKKLGDVNSKSMAFGNSRARSFEQNDKKGKVTFKDVAGNEEAKKELTEVVDFLKRPEEYTKMGARIPRGVLLVGTPGNGKTLMARAIAGEASAPFLFVSGSEFVEMFVGVGAGRVRDLFKQAKKKSPCVIFIDEIDAVGRKRGSGMGSGNDEREQTLNQILVEMDGFEENESVIVIGATNRPDVLDNALMRPGRFDRKVTVTAPDKKEREKILEVHSKGKKLAKNIDLGIIARRTSGFSGADLMNVLNEGAILAVREGQKQITNDILREAIEKVLLGPSLRSKIITEDQKKLTAYHEAGHALMSAVLPEADKVQKVTIIPRGKAGGYTFTDRGENDPTTIKKSKYLAEISVLFAGYITEQMIFGETSTGPSNDLERATAIAREMVTKYGMSDLGPITFGEDKMFRVGIEMEERIPYSQETTKAIDSEVNNILEKCYQTAEEILKKYRKELDTLAEKLIEVETIELEEFDEITKHISTPAK